MSVTIEDVECIAATDNAILCVIDGENRWIPQSQIEVESEVFAKGDKGELIISDWFAAKEDLGEPEKKGCAVIWKKKG
jgi:hypothetical protein